MRISRGVFVSVAIVAVNLPALAQTATQSANAWLRTPTVLAAASASQPYRAARDQYFDSLFGIASPLTAQTAASVHIARPVSAPDIAKIPELPRNPDRAILIATFTEFQSMLSQSQHSIYTEVSFSVNRVFANPTGQLGLNETVTVAIPGGTVQTATATLSFLVDPAEFFIQPQKQYLLVLTYHSEGDFYTLAKDWELINGQVKANSKIEQTRAASGKAAIAGLSETQLLAAIPQLLSSAAP